MDNKAIEYIKFPATLKEIEMNAFYGCTSIKSLIITSELEVIGDNAFYGCSSIGVGALYQLCLDHFPVIGQIGHPSGISGYRTGLR